MTQYVMGIYIGHDASVAIVGDGRIVHLEKERFTRIKHDTGSIDSLIEPALKLMAIDREQVTAIAGASGSLLIKNPSWTSLNDMEFAITNVLGIEKPGYSVPHHAAHAAYAFWTSPFEVARVITLDGGGDPCTFPDGHVESGACSIGSASWGFGTTSGHVDLHIHDGFGLGLAWSAASEQYFGRKNAEGSVMALYGVLQSQFAARTNRSVEAWYDTQALQQRTTDVFHILASASSKPAPIVLAGGCALNGIAVYDLLRRDDVPAVHVPPAAHDGGVCIGAALHVLHHVLKEPRYRYSLDEVAFCGYTDKTLEGAPPIATIVDTLVSKQVVGLVHGRAESGPRALGHRSFLADPRDMAMHDRLNTIKGRESFRPTAPVVLREHAERYFDLINPTCYTYMTTIAHAKPETIAIAPAAVHFDQSARVQIVEADSVLGRIVHGFAERTGVPMLLNTSFNLAGEAIANDSAQALDTFGRSNADLLVIGDTVHRR